jgi:hypothetical protein
MANTNFDSLQLNGYSAADSAGLILGSGTNALPASTSDANKNFIDFRVKNAATSGDNRGMYLREYLAGAGGGGEALRVFTTVDNVAAGTAHGIHCSLSFGTSGTVTGQGIASRNTLHIPATALTSNVTLAALQAEIWSDAATSDPGGSTLLSAIRIVNAGDATGMADVDTDAVAFDFSGWAVTTGCMLYDHTGGAPANTNGSIKIRLPSGALAYIMYYDQQAA